MAFYKKERGRNKNYIGIIEVTLNEASLKTNTKLEITMKISDVES